MIKYYDDKNVAIVDDYVFNRDKKTGYYLSSRKIGDKKKRLHIYVWEKHNGVISKGMHIHHIDHDKTNNEIENLTMMTAKEHMILHGREMPKEQREASAERIKKISDLAKAWHSSEEGRAWHAEHGKKSWENRQQNEYVCDCCGETFYTRNIYSKTGNKFCSNKCRAAFRRKSGVDDITVKCEGCGNEFRANKYSSHKYCKDCRNKRVWRRKRV